MLPDVLTEGDNLEMPPLPDASFLLSQMDDDNSALNRKRRAGSRDINLNEDFGNSQYLQSSILDSRKNFNDDLALVDDLDLDLDLGLDLGDNEPSVEIGLDAPVVSIEDAVDASELNFGKDAAGRGRSVSVLDDDDGFRIVDDDGDINMGEEMTFNLGDDMPLAAPAPIDRARISESPLSDVDPTFVAQIEAEQTTMFDETELAIERRPAQRARKLRTLEADDETTIPNNVIREQQNDHSKILRPQSFLPRDPLLYALMEMQRTGGFVSSVLRDERSAGWAPELRGMLSLDAILSARDNKRKRDSGVADLEADDNAAKSPRLDLDLGDEETLGAIPPPQDGSPAPADATIHQLEDDDAFRVNMDDDEGYVAPVSREGSVANDTFDITRAPLLHPDDQGPVSLGTKHAVHLLRETFGSEAADNAEKRKKASVVFQDLLPESRTSKADATKMFFECLVLATKDAIKVEQKEGDIGAPIRVRGKRGLWGSWAEREAGGEIAETEAQPMAVLPNAIAV